ncbi:hypothetical protein GCM10007275_04510 [Jeotgalicoccus coquinae]|uniref:Uncharacterized protein n=1 Tax=Jeotgalicoccus coquinae TaxID=709509 RepID=A0A6V7R917_9STAP|nr:hypothetical protein [Jeotgalicoccus coquinae]GGE12409.1 hypothetical protein GCM10007275_04510 [Jeotgalicoccus coquinae]CAD2073776.1 hypothetical protein JEOCOQ751_00798 [Jeotgalicoccus coquinae]
MKHLPSGNDGFFSVSVYFLLIYLIGVYYHYFNRFQLVLDIRMNLIEIYISRIYQIIN